MRALLVAVSLALCGALAACDSDDASGGGSGGGEAQGIVREDAQDLSAQEKRDLTDAILKLKRMPSPFKGYKDFSYYDTLVKWHKDAFNCDTQTAHMGPNFLPWHRHLLILLEEGLSEAAGKPIAIPYWDWTDPASTNAVFNDDFMGGDGDPEKGYAVTSGPFRRGEYKLDVVDPKVNDPFQLTYLVRQMGTFTGNEQLPEPRKVERLLTRPIYDTVPFNDQSNPKQSFRNHLEGWRNEIGQKCEDGLIAPLTGRGVTRHELHNGVHLWVGGIVGKRQGTMDLNTSLNDPVFWLHHANIDRLWQAWMEANGELYDPVSGWPRPDQNLNQPMIPYKQVGQRVTPKSVLDIEKLGYSYAELPKAEPAKAASQKAAASAGLVGPPSLGFRCALPT